MEDAHIAAVKLGQHDDIALFGVFDGHGGAEVANFCAKHLADEVLAIAKFQAHDYEGALKDVFHRMDTLLKDGSYANEIALVRPPLADYRFCLIVFRTGQAQLVAFCLASHTILACLAATEGAEHRRRITPPSAHSVCKRITCRVAVQRGRASVARNVWCSLTLLTLPQRTPHTQVHSITKHNVCTWHCANAPVHPGSDRSKEKQRHSHSRHAQPAFSWRVFPAVRVTAQHTAIAAAVTSLYAHLHASLPEAWVDAVQLKERDPNEGEGDEKGEGGEDMAMWQRIVQLKRLVIEKEGEGEGGAVAQVQAGCTAIVALKHKKTLYVANAGDSRGVLCRAGMPHLLSRPPTMPLHHPACRLESVCHLQQLFW